MAIQSQPILNPIINADYVFLSVREMAVLKVGYKVDCKTVRILRIQVRASSQTKGLERG